MNLGISTIMVNKLQQNKNINEQQNLSFGQYFKMKNSVVFDLFARTKSISEDEGFVENDCGLITVEAQHLVQRIYRDIINHNSESMNHHIFDDIKEISEISPSFDSKTSKFNGFWLTTPSEKAPEVNYFVERLFSSKTVDLYPDNINIITQLQNKIMQHILASREESVLWHLMNKAKDTLPKAENNLNA